MNVADSRPPLMTSAIPGLPLFRRGKVRDVYDLGDRLLIVTTDRISAFDVVLPTPIPGKGAVLTQLSLFWFGLLEDAVPNHLDRSRRPVPALARPRGGPRRAVHDRGEDAALPRGVRGARLRRRLGVEGLQGHGQGVRHRASQGAPRVGPPGAAGLHARPPRPRRATTRTSPSSACRRSWAATAPRSCAT